MIAVRINDQQRDGVDEGWIAQTITRLRHEGINVCVTVSLKDSGVDVALPAGVCPSGGGGRPPTPRERAIIEQWNECGLSGDVNFPVGRLISCIKRLERFL